MSEFFETKHGADWTLIGKVDSAKESLPEDQGRTWNHSSACTVPASN